MVHSKIRWKWHECLQARDEILNNDSECENDEYVKDTDQQGFNTKHDCQTNLNEDIFTKEQKLKEDAKFAFALGAKMARMQVEIEREVLDKKRSSIYDFIGINTNVNKRLSIDILEEMNIGQLQVIVNNLYCQIEVNNDELINLLIERDSLSMEQDSVLVDIEDLRKRLQERAINQSKSVIECVRPKENIPKRSFFQNIFSRKFLLK